MALCVSYECRDAPRCILIPEFVSDWNSTLIVRSMHRVHPYTYLYFILSVAGQLLNHIRMAGELPDMPALAGAGQSLALIACVSFS